MSPKQHRLKATGLWLLAALLFSSYFFELHAQNALRFDGVNDQVALANNGAYNFSAFTFEAWIETGTNPGNPVDILSNSDNANNGVEWGIDINGRQTLTIQGVTVTETNVNLYNLPGCTHIAVAYDDFGGSATFYVNGTPASSFPVLSPTATSAPLWIGGDPGTSGKFYAGDLDELKIWNFFLTPSQMAAIYNVSCPSTYSAFLLYMNFDEDLTSQIVHDFSPIANHGVLGASFQADQADPLLMPSFCSFPSCCSVDAEFFATLPIYAYANTAFGNTGSGAISYEWFVNGVLVSTAVNLIYAFPAAGMYIVTLKAQGSTPECYDFQTWIVQAEDPCDPNFTFTANCNTLSFTSSATNQNLQHLWEFGDGASSTFVNPTHLYMAPGTYTVVHTVGFNEDCTTSVSQQINITCFNDPCLVDCNMVPWGDFEAHDFYELVPLYLHIDQWLENTSLPNLNSVELYNGPLNLGNDIDWMGLPITDMNQTGDPIVQPHPDGGDQYVGFGGELYSTLSSESLVFQLCDPIQPGEVYDLSMLLNLHFGDSDKAVFRVQGSVTRPCPSFSQNDLLSCRDEGCVTSCNNGDQYAPYDIAAYHDMDDTWTEYESSYEHPANAPALNYIIIYPEYLCPNIGGSYVLADNIRICPSSIGVGSAVVPNPNVNATFYSQVNAPNCMEVSFTSNGTNGTHTWDFGDGNTSTLVNPTHTYSSIGLYTVTHTVTDGACFGSEVSTVFANCPNCDPVAFPKVYDTPGSWSPDMSSVLGLDFDANNNVYVLWDNDYDFATTSPSAMTVLTKYCEDGEEQWSVLMNGGDFYAWEPNNRISVDDNGNTFALIAFENTMSVGGNFINAVGENIAILKFNDNGVLLASTTIPYAFNTNGYDDVESIKVNDAGTAAFVLLNDRIREINPTTLAMVFDEMGTFLSIDISDNGTYIYYLNSNQVGFYTGFPSTPVATVAPSSVYTDFEFDNFNNLLYVGSGLNIMGYAVTGSSITLATGISGAFNATNYHEFFPTPNGLFVYNSIDNYGSGTPEFIDFYNTSGVWLWNLPINAALAIRSSIMMGFNNGNGYLGAMYWDQLDLGWYNQQAVSGSFVTRFDQTSNWVWKEDGSAFEDAKRLDRSVQLFPNPSQGEVAVKLVYDNLEQVEITVIDAYGQVVLTHGAVDVSSGEGLCSLDLSGHAAGLYFIIASSGGERLSTSKLVRQ